MFLTATRASLLALALTLVSLSGCTALLLGDGSRANSTATSDSAITVRVRNRLAADPGVDAAGIDVATRQGVVFLDGYVPSVAHSERAAELALDVQGARGVRNSLRVTDTGSGSPP